MPKNFRGLPLCEREAKAYYPKYQSVVGYETHCVSIITAGAEGYDNTAGGMEDPRSVKGVVMSKLV